MNRSISIFFFASVFSTSLFSQVDQQFSRWRFGFEAYYYSLSMQSIPEPYWDPSYRFPEEVSHTILQPNISYLLNDFITMDFGLVFSRSYYSMPLYLNTEGPTPLFLTPEYQYYDVGITIGPTFSFALVRWCHLYFSPQTVLLWTRLYKSFDGTLTPIDDGWHTGFLLQGMYGFGIELDVSHNISVSLRARLADMNSRHLVPRIDFPTQYLSFGSGVSIGL